MNNNKEKISIDKRPFITFDYIGNVVEDDTHSKKFLLNEQQQVVSREYDYIQPLYDDHYIVSSAILMIDRDKTPFATIAKVQYGIIRLTRGGAGKVIPYHEKTIVPLIYDGLEECNMNMIRATISEDEDFKYPRFTYIDLEPASKNYGKQLLPIMLESAEWFGQDYEGFAKCTLNGVERYIPRNCEPMHSATPDDLLTEEDMQSLLNDAPKIKLKSLTGGYAKAQVQKKN